MAFAYKIASQHGQQVLLIGRSIPNKRHPHRFSLNFNGFPLICTLNSVENFPERQHNAESNYFLGGLRNQVNCVGFRISLESIPFSAAVLDRTEEARDGDRAKKHFGLIESDSSTTCASRGCPQNITVDRSTVVIRRFGDVIQKNPKSNGFHWASFTGQVS